MRIPIDYQRVLGGAILFRRFMTSTLTSNREGMLGMPVIVTDPAYIKTATEYEENIRAGTAGDGKSQSPGSYVKLFLANSVYSKLSERQTFIRASGESDEMLLVIGELFSLSEYQYLGSHHSDSGLTCLVNEEPFKEAEAAEELDWLELVSNTLESPQDGFVNVELFPLLKFCASIPEDESTLAVFGFKNNQSDNFYTSIVLRAWCKVFSEQ